MTQNIHLHTPGDGGMIEGFYVDTKANILATNKVIGQVALATDTNEIYIRTGVATTITWMKTPFVLVAQSANPDMGAFQDSSRIGYGVDYIDSKSLTRVTVGFAGTASVGGLRVNGLSPSQMLQVYLNAQWENTVTNRTFRENATTGIMEHYPVGKTVWLTVAQEDSLDVVGLNLLPIVQSGVVSMGAFPVSQVLSGGTF